MSTLHVVTDGNSSHPCRYGMRSKRYVLWFFAHSPRYVLVYVGYNDGLNDALDAAVDYAEEQGWEGLFCDDACQEAYEEARDEALADGADEDEAEQAGWDAADVDVTRAGNHGRPIRSEDWGIALDEHASRADVIALRKRIEASY